MVTVMEMLFPRFVSIEMKDGRLTHKDYFCFHLTAHAAWHMLGVATTKPEVYYHPLISCLPVAHTTLHLKIATSNTSKQQLSFPKMPLVTMILLCTCNYLRIHTCYILLFQTDEFYLSWTTVYFKSAHYYLNELISKFM